MLPTVVQRTINFWRDVLHTWRVPRRSPWKQIPKFLRTRKLYSPGDGACSAMAIVRPDHTTARYAFSQQKGDTTFFHVLCAFWITSKVAWEWWQTPCTLPRATNNKNRDIGQSCTASQNVPRTSQFSPNPCIFFFQICNVCILKRDHHCMLTNTCIGFRNQRFFVVMCFYGVIGCFGALAYGIPFIYQQYYASTPAWDYFYPVTVFRWIQGVYPTDRVFLMCHLYSLIPLGFTCLVFLVFQIVAIYTGRTPHEIWKRLRIKSSNSLSKNLHSVFGDFWYLNFLVPVHPCHKQTDDPTTWTSVKIVYNGKVNDARIVWTFSRFYRHSRRELLLIYVCVECAQKLLCRFYRWSSCFFFTKTFLSPSSILAALLQQAEHLIESLWYCCCHVKDLPCHCTACSDLVNRGDRITWVTLSLMSTLVSPFDNLDMNDFNRCCLKCWSLQLEEHPPSYERCCFEMAIFAIFWFSCTKKVPNVQSDPVCLPRK